MTAARSISHVHVADSNRLAPGQGRINFREVLQGLKAVGYDGWLSLEIKQPADALAAAKGAYAHLNNLIKMY
jgi:sugar phosphate isomerase/epimerase